MGERLTESPDGWWKDNAGRYARVFHKPERDRVIVEYADAWTCCDEQTFKRWVSWGWKRLNPDGRTDAGRSLLKENPNG